MTQTFNNTILEEIIRQWHEVIYTTPDWYLDYSTNAQKGKTPIPYTRRIDDSSEWKYYYQVDPFTNSTLNEKEQKQLKEERKAKSLEQGKKMYKSFPDKYNPDGTRKETKDKKNNKKRNKFLGLFNIPSELPHVVVKFINFFAPIFFIFSKIMLPNKIFDSANFFKSDVL